MKSVEFNERVKALEAFAAEKNTGAVILAATAALACELPKWGAAKIYQFRAEALGANGNFAAAVMNYSAAIKEMPDNFELYGGRGGMYCKMGNYQLAILDYDWAIELSPHAKIGYKNRAIAHRLNGDFLAAETDLASAAACAATAPKGSASSRKKRV